jgi:hypothetical protein
MALYTAKGIPMLWPARNSRENWGGPDRGLGRNMYERPLHWEFFYDVGGKALVRLHRIMGQLRRTHRALRSRGYFFYYNDPAHLQRSVIAYRRDAPADGANPAESVLIVLNFSDADAEVWLPFPSPACGSRDRRAASTVRHHPERSVVIGRRVFELRRRLQENVTAPADRQSRLSQAASGPEQLPPLSAPTYSAGLPSSHLTFLHERLDIFRGSSAVVHVEACSYMSSASSGTPVGALCA